jgi:hypothetical protein
MAAHPWLNPGWTEPGLQALWQFLALGLGASLMSGDGEAEEIGRLGISALAFLRESGARGARIRLCDREGCDNPGDRPAPKAPNSPERWYFCEAHAGEYNKNWNYFAGLSPEEAARRAAEETNGANGFRSSAHWQWAGPGDDSRSRDEMRALDALDLKATRTSPPSRPPTAAGQGKSPRRQPGGRGSGEARSSRSRQPMTF